MSDVTDREPGDMPGWERIASNMRSLGSGETGAQPGAERRTAYPPPEALSTDSSRLAELRRWCENAATDGLLDEQTVAVRWRDVHSLLVLLEAAEADARQAADRIEVLEMALAAIYWANGNGHEAIVADVLSPERRVDLAAALGRA